MVGTMGVLICVGDWSESFDLLAALYRGGYELTVFGGQRFPLVDSLPDSVEPIVLLLAALDSETATEQVGAEAQRAGLTWLAWNRTEDPAITLNAYRGGARAVLPGAMTADILLAAVERAAAPSPRQRRDDPASKRVHHYPRGALITSERDAVVVVDDGVVALIATHHDGTEVLLGLFGQAQVIVSHPHDSCAIRLEAQTDTTVSLQSWSDATREVTFARRLREQLLFRESWAAMQARPYLEGRIVGILSLLAEQFGVPHPCGTLVDLRLTHAQLAAATGATRSTITRILGNLRLQGRLLTVGSGDGERFCLPESEALDHQLD